MQSTSKLATNLAQSYSITRLRRISRRRLCPNCHSIFSSRRRKRKVTRCGSLNMSWMPAIDAPKSKFKTARDAVKLSLDQEIHVTQQINGLVELARKQNDYITINFL